jgi:hypothetical protein
MARVFSMLIVREAIGFSGRALHPSENGSGGWVDGCHPKSSHLGCRVLGYPPDTRPKSRVSGRVGVRSKIPV